METTTTNLGPAIRLAADLDLTESDDRAVYRLRVDRFYRFATADKVREHALHAGAQTVDPSRFGACRDLSNALIRKITTNQETTR